MEKVTEKSILESEIYQKPGLALEKVLERLGFGAPLNEYLVQVLTSGDPKNKYHQDLIKPVLRTLLNENRREEAGLIFNIHRTLTEFAGYGANESASSDVAGAFGQDVEIPEQGLIVVDYFVTRNLPKIVEMCEERGVDTGRIRVCAPMGILAAQLMKMSPEKKAEFEKACVKLNEDQFIVEDVNHNADINVEGDVALWFSPRTMPITPKLHAETEEVTVENYREWFREKVSSVLSGGRVYANLAYSEDWRPLEVEESEGKRPLTKLTGISRKVAEEVSKLLVDELNFEQLGRGEFDPSDVNAEIDHAKLAKELHVVKK